MSSGQEGIKYKPDMFMYFPEKKKLMTILEQETLLYQVISEIIQ